MLPPLASTSLTPCGRRKNGGDLAPCLRPLAPMGEGPGVGKDVYGSGMTSDDPLRLEAKARQPLEIHPGLSRRPWAKTGLGDRGEGIDDLLPDLKARWTNAGPKPGHHALRGPRSLRQQGLHCPLQNTRR